jgi:peptide/nickel transport system permease protein
MAVESIRSPEKEQLTGGKSFFGRLKKAPAVVILAIFILVTVVLIAIFGSYFVPEEKLRIDLFSKLIPPSFLEGGSSEHLLGTDEQGRDMFGRLIQALRISLLIASGGSLISAVLGISLGFIAVRYRGTVEDAVMMFADVTWSMPYIILSLAVIAILGQSLVVLMFVIGFGGWEIYARITRGMLLTEQEKGYVFALKSLGMPQSRIYIRHILPNIINTLIVEFTVSFPHKVLSESTLSFLGLGILPPLTSLGHMLGAGRDYLLIAPWITIIPGVVIFLITLSLSVIGDWVRDVLDPTLQ